MLVTIFSIILAITAYLLASKMMGQSTLSGIIAGIVFILFTIFIPLPPIFMFNIPLMAGISIIATITDILCGIGLPFIIIYLLSEKDVKLSLIAAIIGTVIYILLESITMSLFI